MHLGQLAGKLTPSAPAKLSTVKIFSSSSISALTGYRRCATWMNRPPAPSVELAVLLHVCHSASIPCLPKGDYVPDLSHCPVKFETKRPDWYVVLTLLLSVTATVVYT